MRDSCLLDDGMFWFLLLRCHDHCLGSWGHWGVLQQPRDLGTHSQGRTFSDNFFFIFFSRGKFFSELNVYSACDDCLHLIIFYVLGTCYEFKTDHFISQWLSVSLWEINCYRTGVTIILPKSSKRPLAFYPRLVLVFGYCCCLHLYVHTSVCLSLCVCINHKLDRVLTHELFELEPLNSNKRCKTPWLRSLLFCLTLTFTAKFNLKVQFSLCPVCPSE